MDAPSHCSPSDSSPQLLSEQMEHLLTGEEVSTSEAPADHMSSGSADQLGSNHLQAVRSKPDTTVGLTTKTFTPISIFFLLFFPKLHILVSSTSVRLNIDCQEVAEKEIKAAGNTSSDGYQVLGKMSKSVGATGESATVSTASPDCSLSVGIASVH